MRDAAWLATNVCVGAYPNPTDLDPNGLLSGFDVFINLCDGAWDEDRAGIEVAQTLERLGLVFTGATVSGPNPLNTRSTSRNAAATSGDVFARCDSTDVI